MQEWKVISVPDSFEAITTARTADIAFKKTRSKYPHLKRPLQAYPTNVERIEGNDDKSGDELIMDAYKEIASRSSPGRCGYVAMDELYKQIRKRSKISIDEFKAWMSVFYNRHNLKTFYFAHGTSARAECRKYGFIEDGRIQFYIQKKGGKDGV